MATSKRKMSNNRFDLDGLERCDGGAIKETAEIFPDLKRTQQDLIRHRAPDAYKRILKIVNSASTAAHMNNANSSNNATFLHQKTLEADASIEEKRMSYEYKDKQHQRENETQKEMHRDTMKTIRRIAPYAAVATALVVAVPLAAAKISKG